MSRFVWLAVVIAALLPTAAYAMESVLQWDDGQAELFDHMETDSHFVFFITPEDWDKCFAREIRFFGNRYGDVGEIRGTVIILGPQSEKTAKIEDAPDSLVIYYRKQFALADLPEEPDWFTLPVDSVELPTGFAVGIYTYSTDERGADIGLTAESGMPSFSSAVKPGPAAEDEESNIIYRDDGRNWLIRVLTSSTPEIEETFTSANLTGDRFSAFDDGEAEGFISTQKYGPMVHIKNRSGKIIDRIYVYSKVDGDWFDTDRAAGVYLLKPDYGIIVRGSLRYNLFTNEPSWNYVSMDNVPVPEEFYVLIEPASRPQVEMLIGYDSSTTNQASLFGTPGARKNWETEAPEELTNWMIRVRYR